MASELMVLFDSQAHHAAAYPRIEVAVSCTQALVLALRDRRVTFHWIL
jgi:hypothetical protein